MRKAANNDKIGGRQSRRDVKTRAKQMKAANAKKHLKAFGALPTPKPTVSVVRRKPVNPAALAAQVALATREAVTAPSTVYTPVDTDIKAEMAEVLKPVGFVSLEEAAEKLCGHTKNPMKNLKARIAKGTVETAEFKGVTMVRIDG